MSTTRPIEIVVTVRDKGATAEIGKIADEFTDSFGEITISVKKASNTVDDFAQHGGAGMKEISDGTATAGKLLADFALTSFGSLLSQLKTIRLAVVSLGAAIAGLAVLGTIELIKIL